MIEKYFEGQSYSLSHTFTQDNVSLFADISLDKNPVHLSEDYAQTTVFGRRIVHGFLTGSLISAVIGNYMPGPGSIYLKQDMRFLKPVFVGDEITATVTITKIIEEKNILELSTIVKNADGIVVLDGCATIKLM